jgi:WD40 repeat protein
LTAQDPAKTPLILQKGFEGYVYGTGFTPDSRQLVFAGQDRLIRVWDLAADDPAKTPVILRGHEARISGFAISPDGQRLVTGDEDGIVRMWDLHDLGAQPLTLRQHENGVRQLAISPDGRWLVTADGTGRLFVWILPAEELLFLAGRTAARNLSLPEFNQYFSEEPYRRTFPDLPVPDNEYYDRVSGGQTAYYGVRVAD